MLRLVTGRAGSGKTKYIENEFVSRIKNEDKGLVMIVPEQFSFECERMFLRSLSASQARNIDVLSFTRMADRLIDEYGCKRKFLDRGKQAVAMSIALSAVEDELEVYKSRNGKLDFVDGLVKLMSELKHNCVTAQDLTDACGMVKGKILKQKLREAGVISEAYSAVVSEMFFDCEDRLNILYDLVLKSGCFRGKTVAIDSFKGFTEQELRVIGLIAEQADELFVTLCCEGVSHNNEFSLFSCVDKTAKKLIDVAKRANVSVATPIILSDTPRFKTFELKALEKNIFRVNKEKFEGECKNVELCYARDIYDECRWVARRIKKLLREENMRARDIAVIYRNESYAQVLPNILRRCEIPVFEDNRQPLSTQPLLVFVKHLFSAVRSNYNSEEIFKYLKSGLAGITTEQVAELENYVYVWQISGSAWTKEWTGNPRGYEEERESDIAKLAEINTLRERVIIPLKNFYYKCKDGGALEISTAVFELFREINVRGGLLKLAVSLNEQGESALSLEQELAWKFVMNALDDMVNMLGDRKVNLETYERLFGFLVNSSDFGRLPSGLDEVGLGNADRIRTVNPRAVFVVGLNEGEFPKTQTQSGILTDFERKELSKLGTNLLDDGEYKLAEERFLVYSSLCCASERVFASCSKMGIDGTTMSPSEAVAQIKSVFSSLEVKPCAENDEIEYICSDSYAFELLSDKWSDNDVMTATLKKVFSQKEEYAPVMQAIDKIAQKRNFSFENSEVSKALFGDNMYISASKAEDFHKCRFRYFCKFGMRVQNRTVASLDAMKSGLVVHYVMENLLKKYDRDALISASFEEIGAYVDVLMNEYLDTQMGGIDGKNGRFMYLFKRLKVIIKSVVMRTVEEFSRSEFEFVDFELSIGPDGDIPCLTLPLDDGGSVNVQGSVDRVDIFKKDGLSYVRVVDYKTGKKVFKLTDVLNGLNMQMLIYLDCICKNAGERYGEMSPAGVLYMLSRREYNKMSGNKVKKSVSSRMEGLVIDNLEILNAMEKGVEGVFLPAKYDESKGTLSGNVITAGRMGKLLDRLENTLREMGTLLHKGDIAAFPLGDNADNLPCKYCDYKSVCLNDGTFNPRIDLKNDDVFDILDGGEGADGK